MEGWIGDLLHFGMLHFVIFPKKKKKKKEEEVQGTEATLSWLKL